MEFVVNWLAIAPEFAVPYALAALGLIICERSGVLNLGAEGYMLLGAMAGAGAMLGTGSPWLALAVAALSAGALSLVFALLAIGLRVNQVISGLTMVFLAQGLTTLIATTQGWTNRSFTGLGALDLGPLTDLPILGPILFGQDPMVYLAVATVAAASWALRSTMAGMRLRAVGESPEAADAAGVHVGLTRLGAVVIGGMLVGLAGGYISVAVSRIWVDGMSGGRGWIAIALVIFARWRPWWALAGALIFGCIEALIPRLAAIGLQLPQYFVLMTPYVVTLGVMVWTSLRHGARDGQPGALGRPFLREERS